MGGDVLSGDDALFARRMRTAEEFWYELVDRGIFLRPGKPYEASLFIECGGSKQMTAADARKLDLYRFELLTFLTILDASQPA